MHGIEQQFLALQKGFNELIPQSLLKVSEHFWERFTQTLIMIDTPAGIWWEGVGACDWWIGHDWPAGLEDEHPAETLHCWNTSGEQQPRTLQRLGSDIGFAHQVVWFWNIVGSYSEEMRARLLQFVTGSSRVPLQGFKALQVFQSWYIGRRWLEITSFHRVPLELLDLGFSHFTLSMLTLAIFPRPTHASIGAQISP